MNSIDKKTLNELREKHKDVLEDEGLKKVAELKTNNEKSLGYNPNNYPVMSEGAYSEKCKLNLAYLARMLGQ